MSTEEENEELRENIVIDSRELNPNQIIAMDTDSVTFAVDMGSPNSLNVVIVERSRIDSNWLRRAQFTVRNNGHIDRMSAIRLGYLRQVELYRRLFIHSISQGVSARREGIASIMDRVDEFNAKDSWWGRRKLERKRKKRRKKLADARTKTTEQLIAQGNYIHECAYNNDRGEIIYPGTPINLEGNPVESPSRIDQSIRGARLNEIRGGENLFRIIWQGYASGKAHSSDHKCAICGDIIHNNNNFPQDYPERLKLCCKCTDAWHLSNGTTRALNFYHYSPAIMKEHYNAYKQDFERLFQLEVV